nr:MAG TPA: hypothetical protein [Caudoviricetes sp.]
MVAVITLGCLIFVCQKGINRLVNRVIDTIENPDYAGLG